MKLGQPVPLSNLCPASKSGNPQSRTCPVAVLVEQTAAECCLGPMPEPHVRLLGREIRRETRALIERRRREVET